MSRATASSCRGVCFAVAMVAACSDNSARPDAGPGIGSFSSGDSGDDGGSVGDGPSDGADGTVLDVAAPADDGGGDAEPQCAVVEDDVVGSDCEDVAPPDSFEPVVEWELMPADGIAGGSTVTPLVANLTDDNGDGVIDLCDGPDIVVVRSESSGSEYSGRIVVLDGATGTEKLSIDRPVLFSVNPALGDIDGDGVPEIVAGESDGTTTGGHLVAFEHDGTLAWTGDQRMDLIEPSAIALADLDADGDVEIMLHATVTDHEGHMLWNATADLALGYLGWVATTAADLDGDDDLEVVVGPNAYHHDGSLYYALTTAEHGFVRAGQPQVADLDGDGEPEVLVAAFSGMSIIEHDGTESAVAMQAELTEMRPASILDIDGDGQPNILLGSRSTYSAFTADLVQAWTVPTFDLSCCAGATAFDFLGDGTAETIFADERAIRIFDAQGQSVFEIPHGSGTAIETPIVADVDNDGSAEIVIVANGYVPFTTDLVPIVQVIGDIDDRWVQARRIWNQHAYHVTNVREDGTIPRVQPKHWESLNTFRAQARITGDGICLPPPAG